LKTAKQAILFRNADFAAHYFEGDQLLVRIEQIRRAFYQAAVPCALFSHRQRQYNRSPLLFKPNAGVIELALVIYTKPGCPYCQEAREYYDSKGIPFLDYDAQTDRARRAEMFSFSGGDPTVPCIVQDGKYIGSGWGNPPRG
jgi:glutaredoxin 3